MERRKIADLVPQAVLQLSHAGDPRWRRRTGGRSSSGARPAGGGTPAHGAGRPRLAAATADVDRTTVEVDDAEFGRLVFDTVVEGRSRRRGGAAAARLPADVRSWWNQVPALVEAGYRVVAPDQRGYSPGARPADAVGLSRRRAWSPTCSAWPTRSGPTGSTWSVTTGVGRWRGRWPGRHADRLRTLAVLSTPHPAAFGWRWRATAARTRPAVGLHGVLPGRGQRGRACWPTTPVC